MYLSPDYDHKCLPKHVVHVVNKWMSEHLLHCIDCITIAIFNLYFGVAQKNIVFMQLIITNNKQTAIFLDSLIGHSK
jgi:hypothetical protein